MSRQRAMLQAHVDQFHSGARHCANKTCMTRHLWENGLISLLLPMCSLHVLIECMAVVTLQLLEGCPFRANPTSHIPSPLYDDVKHMCRNRFQRFRMDANFVTFWILLFLLFYFKVDSLHSTEFSNLISVDFSTCDIFPCIQVNCSQRPK